MEEVIREESREGEGIESLDAWFSSGGAGSSKSLVLVILLSIFLSFVSSSFGEAGELACIALLS